MRDREEPGGLHQPMQAPSTSSRGGVSVPASLMTILPPAGEAFTGEE
jgi:hypothetical protein